MLPTRYGDFTGYGYRSFVDDRTHMALVVGEVAGKENVLVRVHSECLTGDVFHSLRCDCGAQLEEAMRRVQEQGEGVILYIVGHEGRGIGLAQQAQGLRAPRAGCRHCRGQRGTRRSRRIFATTVSARRSCATWACTRFGS